MLYIFQKTQRKIVYEVYNAKRMKRKFLRFAGFTHDFIMCLYSRACVCVYIYK